MKCPQCVKEGKKSIVYPGSSSTTNMHWDPYYDEDGKYHSHDPNHHTKDYCCSKGHMWIKSGLDRCPNCDYGKEKKG